MPKTPKNTDAIGIALVLLLATRRSGRLPAVGQAIDFGLFTHNLHRMVDMIYQLGGLTQLTHRTPPLLNSSSSGYNYDQGYDRGNDYDHNYDQGNDRDYDYSYDKGHESGSEHFIPDSFNLPDNFNLPDMGQLMEMAGPLLSLFGGRR